MIFRIRHSYGEHSEVELPRWSCVRLAVLWVFCLLAAGAIGVGSLAASMYVAKLLFFSRGLFFFR